MEPASSGISWGTSYGFGTIQVTSETVDWSQMWRFWNAFTLSVLHDVIIYDLHAWCVYVYIYIYKIKWTVFVNVTTKSAQHAHARMIAIIVEKSPNSSHVYDHGFMDNTNRQAVCKSQKKSFEWFTNSRRITLKTIKTHHNQSKRPVTI